MTAFLFLKNSPNDLGFRTVFSFCSFEIKCWYSGLEFTVCMSEEQTRKTMVGLLKIKDKEALFNVAYNVTDNISS